MNDTVLTAHIEHLCREARNGIVVLWYSDSFDDKLHISRLKSVETLFDLCPGGFAYIAGKNWQMFEQKCADREGIYVYLRLVQSRDAETHPGAHTQAEQRPHTREEWRQWATNYYRTHGKPLVDYKQAGAHPAPDCTCTPLSDACTACRETVQDTIGDEIPY